MQDSYNGQQIKECTVQNGHNTINTTALRDGTVLHLEQSSQAPLSDTFQKLVSESINDDHAIDNKKNTFTETQHLISQNDLKTKQSEIDNVPFHSGSCNSSHHLSIQTSEREQQNHIFIPPSPLSSFTIPPPSDTFSPYSETPHTSLSSSSPPSVSSSSTANGSIYESHLHQHLATNPPKPFRDPVHHVTGEHPQLLNDTPLVSPKSFKQPRDHKILEGENIILPGCPDEKSSSLKLSDSTKTLTNISTECHLLASTFQTSSTTLQTSSTTTLPLPAPLVSQRPHPSLLSAANRQRLKRGEIVRCTLMTLIPGKTRRWHRVKKRIGHIWAEVWEAIPNSEDPLFRRNLQILTTSAAASSRRQVRSTRTMKHEVREFNDSNVDVLELNDSI